jgi:Bacterial Ig-like domain (group 2)
VVTWSSTVAAAALIGNAAGSQGLATSAGQGATTIAATDPATGVVGYTNLTVTPAVMVSIAITPAASSQALGYEQQFTAVATFSDNSTQDVTATVTWQSTATAVAIISNATGSNGLATSTGVGSTTISATDPGSGIARTTSFTITPAVLVSVTVSPTPTTVSLGFGRQFAASGLFSDNSTQDLTDVVTWSSSTTAVATVSNAAGSHGLASSAGVGSTTITAIDPATGIDGAASLQVTEAVLVSLVVTPANLSLAPGFTQQFLATGIYSDSTSQNLTNQVTWSSSTAAATISNTPGSVGLATGVSGGTTSIVATHTLTGTTGSTTLVVGSGIVHRQTTTATSGSGVLSITLTVPALTAAGDQMLAAIAVRASSPTVTAPTGWALARRSSATGTGANSLWVFRRTAAAGEPVNQVFTLSASAGAVGCISTFQGVNTTNPVHQQNTRTTASSLSHATNSVTTTLANTMLVTFHGIGSNATWTPPAGMNEVADLQSGVPDTTGGVGMTVSWEFRAATGATGGRTAVASSNAAIGNATIIALRN